MARNSGDGFDRFVVWLFVFAFFGPALALKLTNTIDQVIVTMAPYATVLAVTALGVYLFRTRY